MATGEQTDTAGMLIQGIQVESNLEGKASLVLVAAVRAAQSSAHTSVTRARQPEPPLPEPEGEQAGGHALPAGVAGVVVSVARCVAEVLPE